MIKYLGLCQCCEPFVQVTICKGLPGQFLSKIDRADRHSERANFRQESKSAGLEQSVPRTMFHSNGICHFHAVFENYPMHDRNQILFKASPTSHPNPVHQLSD
jgi:hypothetical protein